MNTIHYSKLLRAHLNLSMITIIYDAKLKGRFSVGGLPKQWSVGFKLHLGGSAEPISFSRELTADEVAVRSTGKIDCWHLCVMNADGTEGWITETEINNLSSDVSVMARARLQLEIIEDLFEPWKRYIDFVNASVFGRK